jgi:hypothetical protein
MAREEFVDSLRLASRLLSPHTVSGERGPTGDPRIGLQLDVADLWLTPKAVEGFDPTDFADWPKADREELAKEIAAFKAIAVQVVPNKPATKPQSKQARKHLDRAIAIVRRHLLPEWLEAQERMIDEASTAAKTQGWYVEKDMKEVLESLLGKYQAPRLRIRTQDKEVVLDPIARFGSGRQGVVDLVVLPTYETVCLVVFKDNRWQIMAPLGTQHRRPFTPATLVNTITRL